MHNVSPPHPDNKTEMKETPNFYYLSKTKALHKCERNSDMQKSCDTRHCLEEAETEENNNLIEM